MGGSLSNVPTALCVWRVRVHVSVYVLVCDELLSHGSPLHSVGDRLWVTLNYCLSNTCESMWNGYNSVHKDESTRASRKLSMTCNTSNEFTPATVGKSHCINDFLEHVRFRDGSCGCEKRGATDGLRKLWRKGNEISTVPWKTDTGENQFVDKVSRFVFIREGKLIED